MTVMEGKRVPDNDWLIWISFACSSFHYSQGMIARSKRYKSHPSRLIPFPPSPPSDRLLV
jgi:hypothetical protein